MTTATLSRIGKPSEPWKHPTTGTTTVFIELDFADHDRARHGVTPENVEARLRDLNERLNKPADWEFGESANGKPTVKIPQEGGGGGSKGKGWQPKSIEERAEIMSMNMLGAAVALCAAPDMTITFDRAIRYVKEGMGDLLTYTREALKVSEGTGVPAASSENVGAGLAQAQGTPMSTVGSQPAPTPRSSPEDAKESQRVGEGAPAVPAFSGEEPIKHRYKGDGDGPCLVEGCGYYLEGHP